MQQNEVYQKLKNWAQNNNNVRAMILTSSRVDPKSKPDVFSDYDIELYVSDIEPFLNDEWLKFFDKIMVCWPLKPISTFDKNRITRLVHFKNRNRIDFQITAQKQTKPITYDSGYQILIDKDGIEKQIKKPTYKEHIITKPSKEEFLTLVNDFFWDATYIAKNLWREELFYAKFMFDSVIRFEYFEKMIEWYIAMQHNWEISTNKHGRYFKRYLEPKEWKEIEKTFAGADNENNWQAFFKTIELFSSMAKKVAKGLDYDYPEKIDSEITKYCHEAKTIEKE